MLLLLGFSLVVALSYVAAIRVGVPPDLATLDRNDPPLIRFRLRRVAWLCAFLTVAVPWVNWAVFRLYPSYSAALRQLGLFPGLTVSGCWTQDCASIAKAAAKMAVLYMGPLAAYFLSNPAVGKDLKAQFGSLWGFRDHVFAPATEELVYRAAVVSILRPQASDYSVTVYLPLLFGVAHLHHGLQLYRDQVPKEEVAVQVLFQLVYTSVFGVVTNYVYMSSGCNLWTAVVVHAAANLGSFPLLERTRWYAAYCALLVAGMALFWYLV